jgi:aldose 1-epimerase
MTEQLHNDRWAMEIEPLAGGRVGRLGADGTDLLIGRNDLADGPTSVNWGSYPMVPWAGRIRRGQFSFEGRVFQLPINFGRHAIHGVGLIAEWTVGSRTDTSIGLELVLPRDMRWPFGGTARQRIELDGATLTMTLSVTADDRAFPASLGWHPWFRKPESFDFHPSRMYARDDDQMTIDQLVDVPPGPWDDCFVNDQPVVVGIEGATVRLTSNCDHWVVYDEPAVATCIEPQTGPPDAPNIRPNIVGPGATLSAWYRLEIIDR